jgi:hypothetical protein
MLSRSISDSKKLNRVSDSAALLFSWLIPHCDDGGNMDGDADSIKSVVFPRRIYTFEYVENLLTELENNHLITFYEIKNNDGITERYVHVNQFEKHQTLRGDRPDYRFPEPNNLGKPSGNQVATTGKRNLTELNGTELNPPQPSVNQVATTGKPSGNQEDNTSKRTSRRREYENFNKPNWPNGGLNL